MDQIDAEPISLASGQPCPVRWRRSRRARRVSIRIDLRAGAVVVTLPPRARRRAGMALLTTHAAWVMGRLAALAPHTPLEAGAEIPLGGLLHTVSHLPEAAGEVALAPGAILVPGEAATLAPRLAAFLKAEAGRRIRVLVAGHAALLGVTPRAIRLKDTRSRWGSCAPDGTLAFSWRLVMAPDWVLDYVVAHEVAHLKELNHGARFWAHVARLTPHRDAAVAWLRENGPSLLRVG
ncbi:M48 family metallopeptidase [Siccirubricoccus sp. KC 17139]|uniref:M48 family metallopeptidase n=1 Tax=Siccirubricoccus soli TaxID=2899147 RepID=A0ABT1DDC6_9PROT|nr:SprT family zinc-dependent metalloprotease [Siccirubricoccus soli]MCO6419934.1 M48 family metallopeptidase [Siccirubricoccus soli]MCP2686069.1 M48 family metallopeptidase [Siccirubricoccus soli]